MTRADLMLAALSQTIEQHRVFLDGSPITSLQVTVKVSPNGTPRTVFYLLQRILGDRSMSKTILTPKNSPGDVRTLLGGNLVDSRICPVCRATPLAGRQTVCSARCRIARSRQRREANRCERDAKVGLLLRTVLDTVQEARELLKEPPG